MDDWGFRLREALATRGIRKLYALAAEVGVHESAISRWQNGMPVSMANAVALCRVLDISLDWLLTGRGTMEHHVAPERPIVVPGPFSHMDEARLMLLKSVIVDLNEAVDSELLRLRTGGAGGSRRSSGQGG